MRTTFPWGRSALAGATLALGFTMFACGGRDVRPTDTELAGVTEADLRTLAGKRIFFGHQSVGADVIAGVQDILRERPDSGLRVVEGREASVFASPAFAHALNGENEHPATKIAAFEATMEQGIGGKADLAFFKFCYVDIRANTDVVALFEEYKNSMSRLQSRFPSTTFVHVTVPLTTIQSGPKAWAKRLLGKEDGYARDNVQRARYNELLKAEYGHASVFDLAAAESTWEDGRRRTFDWDDRIYTALIEGYSYDGRHLNERGRKWVAERLLAFLSATTVQGGGDRILMRDPERP